MREMGDICPGIGKVVKAVATSWCCRPWDPSLGLRNKDHAAYPVSRSTVSTIRTIGGMESYVLYNRHILAFGVA